MNFLLTVMTKYRAVKVDIDGIKFASHKEAERYIFLRSLVQKGAIDNLELQKKYELIPKHTKANGKIERACYYLADFVYNRNGKQIVEDVKGYKGGGAYAVYKIKRKLMLDRYGIEIQEV